VAEYVRIPLKRVAVLIGKSGETRTEVERVTGASLKVESETGEVFIQKAGEDPLSEWKARDMVKAIGRGFSPEKAFLLKNEDIYLYIIDLHEFLGQSDKKIKRLKGRVIGKDGKMRNVIEQITKTYISVYGKTISLIGDINEIELAKEAIKMLLTGSAHSTVINYLNRKKRDLSKTERELKQLNSNEG